MATDVPRPLETGWLPDTPSTDNVLWGFLGNQVEFNAAAARASGGTASAHEGIAVARSTTPVPYSNMAVLTRPLLDPDDDRLEVAAAELAGTPATLLSVWPTPDLAPRGWSLVGHPAFVVRPPAPPPTGPPPDDVEVVVVGDPDALARFEEVVVEGYPIEEAAGAPPGSLYGADLLSRPGVTLRLGLLEGRAVAAGAVHVDDAVVNLAMGATLPAARRRGVWQALVWARVAEAADRPAVAFTSDDSRPGFVKMGFAPVLRFTLWARSG